MVRTTLGQECNQHIEIQQLLPRTFQFSVDFNTAEAASGLALAASSFHIRFGWGA
jgi:hypothetical protein